MPWTTIGQSFPRCAQALFEGNGRAGYNEVRVETQKVKSAILGHGEFKAYRDRVRAIIDKWCDAHKRRLMGIEGDTPPASVIDALSEDLLTRFTDLPLLDSYDIYQRLMDYWDEPMQDDVDLIAADGWVDAAKPRGIIEDKEKKIKETPDLTVKRKKYKMDLVPPALIVARYFVVEQAAIEALQARHATADRELEDFVEEHTGEEGFLADAANDKGKVANGGVNERLKAIGDEPESDEERCALTRCMELIDAESAASKAVKVAQGTLDATVLARYATLTEDQIKTLVIEDKWYASLRVANEGEVERLTQRLTGRLKELDERLRPAAVGAGTGC